MASVDCDCAVHAFVDKAFRGVAVRIFLGQFFNLQHRMLPEKFLYVRCVVIGCIVDEQDYFLQAMPFCIRNQAGQVFSKLYVSPALEAAPDYVLLRPEQRNEAVDALRIAGRPDELLFPFENP